MSIHKFIISIFFVLYLIVPSFAAPIQFIQGGIPLMSPKQLVANGMRLGNVNYLRKAWRHYENAVKLDKKNNSDYLALGRIYFYLSLLGDSTDKDFAEAQKYTKLALDNNPNSANAHRAMGLIMAGRGAFINGLQELTLAAHLNPNNESLNCDLAMLHLAAHEPRKAISLLEGKYLKNGWSYIVLAMAWNQEHKKGRAILNLLKAKRMGYKGYWLKNITKQLAKSSGLPLN